MNVTASGLLIELTRKDANDLYNEFEVLRRSVDPGWWHTTVLKAMFDELAGHGIQGDE